MVKRKKFKYGFLKGKIDERYGPEYSHVFTRIWDGKSVKEKYELEELVEYGFVIKSEDGYQINYDKVDEY